MNLLANTPELFVDDVQRFRSQIYGNYVGRDAHEQSECPFVRLSVDTHWLPLLFVEPNWLLGGFWDLQFEVELLQDGLWVIGCQDCDDSDPEVGKLTVFLKINKFTESSLNNHYNKIISQFLNRHHVSCSRNASRLLFDPPSLS